jgi:ferritin-like metal-binding protein YciE
MATVSTLQALLIDELRDLFHAENQLIKAWPKMTKAAASIALKAGFAAHLVQTKIHVERLGRALQALGLPPRGRTCHAMRGLVREGAEAIAIKGPAAVRDAALIGAAQRVEHYEIAGYGTAHAFALAMGENRVADLLRETLDEEGETNQELTRLSVVVNADARSSREPFSAPKRRHRKFPFTAQP